MLATTTTDTLGIVDSALLKKLPSSIPACLDLIASPVASSWSPDNINLFIASSRTIHKYDSSSNIIRSVYDVEGSESIRALVSKDKDTIIFSLDNHINIFRFQGSETYTVQALGSHKAPVTSLSLSNDSSLLASASTGVVYVHNIASGSHTVLRGLGNGEPGSTSVTFHMHSRTRLLVSLARQILVYDTTRPSNPLKAIPLFDSSPGDIVALSCSPFSKTLSAIATSLGFVVMVDLEKDKPYVRSLLHSLLFFKLFTPGKS
jgi:protein NEDD1